MKTLKLSVAIQTTSPCLDYQLERIQSVTMSCIMRKECRHFFAESLWNLEQQPLVPFTPITTISTSFNLKNFSLKLAALVWRKMESCHAYEANRH
ncbi:hypothetical protein I7I53_12054 [Histoplasma capsulatum var. duboisii H88]|uniref:Uncharacterized protein n=1 Tax=Ajellomyces capsulatus (strain H88) TaxID=544711 RepID=A0A8A1LX25_AJEC8|nr:hypothetical protein I7I53_12054 [Histoplasma capsulatum var. duboisii H88]